MTPALATAGHEAVVSTGVQPPQMDEAKPDCYGPAQYRAAREPEVAVRRSPTKQLDTVVQMSNDEKERELQKRILESPSLLPGFEERARPANHSERCAGPPPS